MFFDVEQMGFAEKQSMFFPAKSFAFAEQKQNKVILDG